VLFFFVWPLGSWPSPYLWPVINRFDRRFITVRLRDRLILPDTPGRSHGTTGPFFGPTGSGKSRWSGPCGEGASPHRPIIYDFRHRGSQPLSQPQKTIGMSPLRCIKVLWSTRRSRKRSGIRGKKEEITSARDVSAPYLGHSPPDAGGQRESGNGRRTPGIQELLERGITPFPRRNA